MFATQFPTSAGPLAHMDASKRLLGAEAARSKIGPYRLRPLSSVLCLLSSVLRRSETVVVPERIPARLHSRGDGLQVDPVTGLDAGEVEPAL